HFSLPVLFFFFSSRRRHTRSKRDWSSDVCSSDLCVLYVGMIALLLGVFFGIGLMILAGGSGWLLVPMIAAGVACLRVGNWWLPKIGRASCREREEVGNA